MFRSFPWRSESRRGRTASPNYRDGLGHGAKVDGEIQFKARRPTRVDHYGTTPVPKPPKGKREVLYLESQEVSYHMMVHVTPQAQIRVNEALMSELDTHMMLPARFFHDVGAECVDKAPTGCPGKKESRPRDRLPQRPAYRLASGAGTEPGRGYSIPTSPILRPGSSSRPGSRMGTRSKLWNCESRPARRAM